MENRKRYFVKKMFSTKMGLVGVAMMTMLVISASAQLYSYYMETTINAEVTGLGITYDGELMQDLSLVNNITLNAGTIWTENHNISYVTGSAPTQSISFNWSTPIEGLTYSVLNNGSVPITNLTLIKGQNYTITLSIETAPLFMTWVETISFEINPYEA